MVSLTLAPTVAGNSDWQNWYVGLVPAAIFLIGTAYLVQSNILSWRDPLGDLQASSAKLEDGTTSPRIPVSQVTAIDVEATKGDSDASSSTRGDSKVGGEVPTSSFVLPQRVA